MRCARIAAPQAVGSMLEKQLSFRKKQPRPPLGMLSLTHRVILEHLVSAACRKDHSEQD